MSWLELLGTIAIAAALFIGLIGVSAVIVGAKAEKRQRKVMDKK